MAKYVSGATWRGKRSVGWDTARCTYNPIDPWSMRERPKPFDVFVNGSACLSYATIDKALAHLRARGFTMPDEPMPLYPNELDVTATNL